MKTIMSAVLVVLASTSAFAGASTPAQQSVQELQAVLSARELQQLLGPQDRITQISYDAATQSYDLTTATGCELTATIDHAPLGSPRFRVFFGEARCTDAPSR